MKKYNKYDLTNDFGIGYTIKNEEFYFDLEDYELIKNYCWRIRTCDGYVDAKIPDGSDKRILLHRLVTGNPESIIDHIDNVKYNSRKNNLRLVTDSQNNMNKDIQKNNTTGYNGVSWHKRDCCYEAHISIDKKQIYLGRFDVLNDATIAREKAEEKYFKEYSYKNSQLISDANQ